MKKEGREKELKDELEKVNREISLIQTQLQNGQKILSNMAIKKIQIEAKIEENELKT